MICRNTWQVSFKMLITIFKDTKICRPLWNIWMTNHNKVTITFCERSLSTRTTTSLYYFWWFALQIRINIQYFFANYTSRSFIRLCNCTEHAIHSEYLQWVRLFLLRHEAQYVNNDIYSSIMEKYWRTQHVSQLWPKFSVFRRRDSKTFDYS